MKMEQVEDRIAHNTGKRIVPNEWWVLFIYIAKPRKEAAGRGISDAFDWMRYQILSRDNQERRGKPQIVNVS